MNRSEISLILQELNLHEDCVANIYHHGSWVYGSNTPESDRDLIFVTRSPEQKPIQFHEDFDYFHEFELHKLWNKYDICVYSVQNFEILLRKSYLVAIQCVFLPNAFKIKEDIDFRTMYLEKYYNPLRLKQVGFYEMSRNLNLYDRRNQGSYTQHPKCSSRQIATRQLRMNYVFKNLFHGIRYLDFVEQLLRTKSIYNFRRATHLLHKMKTLRGDPSSDSDLESVGEFVRQKTAEYKPKFNALMPENIVRGTFEVNITFDCTGDAKHVIDKLKKVCTNTKYKIVFVQWMKYEKGKENCRELMVLSHYKGEYPSIVKEIEDEAYKHFQDFEIIGMKIKSSISNEGVPQSDLEKQLFWNDTTNYFELRYKVPSKEDPEGEKITHLRDMYLRSFKNRNDVRLSQKAFMKKPKRDRQYMLTICLSDIGRGNAFVKNDEIVEYLTRNKFPPLKVIREFIVYDTNINLVQI